MQAIINNFYKDLKTSIETKLLSFSLIEILAIIVLTNKTKMHSELSKTHLIDLVDLVDFKEYDPKQDFIPMAVFTVKE